MKYVPWYLKILIKIILSRLPLNYSFWQKIGLFRHGHMDKIDYIIKVFERHIDFAELDKNNLEGRHFIELGPGDSILSSLLAYSYGARLTLVDVGHFVKEDINFYKSICNELTKLNYKMPDISNCKNINDILEKVDSKYLTDGVNSLKTMPAESVDLIFSQAVLEHVRKKDFKDLAQEIKRILKKHGTSSHAIDLKDHLNYSLNNLRFTDKLWETEFFANSGFYTNRLSISDIIDVYKNIGFRINIMNKLTWDEIPLSRSKFAQQFKNRPLEDLLVSEFDLILKHKQ
jgi:SAM-dependent methyltransferase